MERPARLVSNEDETHHGHPLPILDRVARRGRRGEGGEGDGLVPTGNGGSTGGDGGPGAAAPGGGGTAAEADDVAVTQNTSRGVELAASLALQDAEEKASGAELTSSRKCGLSSGAPPVRSRQRTWR